MSRTAKQTLFCEKCGGPGIAFVKATKQQLCIKCLQATTLAKTSVLRLRQRDGQVIAEFASKTASRLYENELFPGEIVPEQIQSKTKRKRKVSRQTLRMLASIQGGKCYYCGILVERGLHCGLTAPKGMKFWTVDHKTPLARGGTNRSENLVACCSSCNHEKGCLTEQEFRACKTKSDVKELRSRIEFNLRTNRNQQ